MNAATSPGGTDGGHASGKHAPPLASSGASAASRAHRPAPPGTCHGAPPGQSPSGERSVSQSSEVRRRHVRRRSRGGPVAGVSARRADVPAGPCRTRRHPVSNVPAARGHPAGRAPLHRRPARRRRCLVRKERLKSCGLANPLPESRRGSIDSEPWQACINPKNASTSPRSRIAPTRCRRCFAAASRPPRTSRRFGSPTAKAAGAASLGPRWASRVDHIAAGLIALGINPEDRVALASGTRYEWVIADFGILASGAATTTVYPTTNAEDVAFIVANSGSRIVIAEDQKQVDKLVAHRAEIPAVEHVVIIDGAGDGNWVISLEDLEQRGKQLLADSPSAVNDRIDAIQPDQLATLIYTSGTTGKPKGVRLTQSSWTYTAAAMDALGVLSDKDLNYLWLPLAHAFGKVMLALPLTIGFPTVIDGRVDKIIENLAHHPTDHHGRRPAHLREGARTDQRDDGQGSRRQEDHVRLGDGRRIAHVAGQAGRREALSAARSAAQDRRPVGVLHDPAALRRATALLHLRFGGPGPRDRPVVRRHRRSSFWRVTASPRRRRHRRSTGRMPTGSARSGGPSRRPRSRSPPTAKSCCADPGS